MPIIRTTLTVILVAVGAGGAIAMTQEMDFMAQNAAAMDRMMNAMAVKPSGDVDVDFVNMMEPHHQGAVDMAVLELRYGHNDQLRRIAQQIIAEQPQEIGAMRIALGRRQPASPPAPDQAAIGH